MTTRPGIPKATALADQSTVRGGRRRVVGHVGTLAYFVALACLSQAVVIFAGHSASPSAFFGFFTNHASPASPLIDNADGYLRQALDYLGANLIVHGHSPWWNPYSGLGSPLAQDWASAVFYPISFVVEWLHLDSTGIDVTSLADMVAAGLCAFWLARVLGLRRSAALVAGTAYALSGSFIWGGTLFANVIAWTPASLALTVRLLDPEGPRRKDVVLLAAVTAMQVLGGYPEPLGLQFLFLTVPLGIAYLLRLDRGWVRAVLAVAEGVGLGFAVTAFLWLPFLKALPSELVWNGPGEAIRHLPAWADVVFLAPFSLGHWFQPPLTPLQWYTIGGYVGGVAAWLALAAVFGWRRRPIIVIPFAVSALVVIMWVNGVAPVAWLGKLPLISVVPVARLALPSLELAVAILAAVAVDRAPTWSAAIGSTLVVGGSLAYMASAAPSALKWKEVLIPIVCIAVVGAGLAAVKLSQTFFKHTGAAQLIKLVGSAVVMVALIGELLIVSNVDWRSAAPSASTWVAPQWVGYVQTHLEDGRLYTADGLLYPQYSGDFDVRSLSFQDGVAPKLTVAFYKQQIGSTLSPFGFIGSDYQKTLAQHLQGLELAGATMAALPDPGCSSVCDHLQLLDLDRASGVGVFALPDPQPMVWLPAETVTGDSVPTAPLSEAAVPTGSGVATGTQGPVGGLQMEGDNSQIEINVDSAARRLLVLRQLDFPGWTATVNGAPAPVVLVDGVFQGVVVPSGRSTVVFSYEPPGLQLGEVISLLAILWIGIVALIAWRRRRRPTAVGDPPGPAVEMTERVRTLEPSPLAT
jgi:Bacterial membrane protein YfhO